MSIRPDWWIRERAREGMIEPFVEHLERSGVISYGLSSFGYDLRAAPEWRVFVNAFNTVVDPKHFDPRSLVEVDGDTCIIPPNSFALTRSVEYLRIPDDTMVVALGKSSYARCFRGDTRVALVGGTSATLEEMAEGAREGASYFGYAVDASGVVVTAALEAPRFIGRDALVEVVLDDGVLIHATPDHRFMLRDGGWCTADELRSGTSLMPLYRETLGGVTSVYQPRSAGSGRALRNHEVASVRPLAGEHDVYCLTVPEAGNFALEAGVFVSNCGIVANVTPLEPGWEGHVTLELSNTTPLPAKVYANEGVVQLLFFQGDRPEVTYRDRKGKYQGQRGITLPRLGDEPT